MCALIRRRGGERISLRDSLYKGLITYGGVQSALVQFVLLCPRSASASLEFLDHVWARQEGSYSGRCKRGTHGIVVYAFIVLE